MYTQYAYDADKGKTRLPYFSRLLRNIENSVCSTSTTQIRPE